MKLDQANKIYFSGIGGVGMSGLARLLKADGKTITGSDSADSALVEGLISEGIGVHQHQNGSGIDEDVDLVIFTTAIPADHPERKRAEDLDVATLSYFEAVGEYMKGFETAIAISGTHGKSSTTAMIAKLLTDAGLNPTALVGSIVKEFESNARPGGKEIIVVEACEHNEHMLNLHPDVIVLTNIEADHLDHYKTFENVKLAFQKYVSSLPKSGLLIINEDDAASADLEYAGERITYGRGEQITNGFADIKVADQTQSFTSNGEEYSLQVPGEFNVYNALAAISLGRKLGIEEEVIKKSLSDYSGIWRRFEMLGEYRNALIVSDYGHHPTEVESTIAAAKSFYPNKRIVVAFQPHQRARTKELFDDFVDAFKDADYLIIQEIFDVAGREDDEYADISSRDLADAIAQDDQFPVYTPDVAATREALDDALDKNDLVLIMGAGDIYKLAEEITP